MSKAPKCKFIREEVYSWTPDELADEIERLSDIALERGEALEAVMQEWVNGRKVCDGITLTVRQQAEAALRGTQEEQIGESSK